MGRHFPRKKVSSAAADIAPKGSYLLRVESLDEEESKAGRLMYSFEARIVEPARFKGMPVYKYFTVGTESDPYAEEDSTWEDSRAASQMAKLFEVCGIDISEDMDENCEAVRDCEFVASLGIEESEGYDPKNRLGRLYAKGEREVEVDEGEKSRSRSARPSAAPSKASKASKANGEAKEERRPAKREAATEKSSARPSGSRRPPPKEEVEETDPDDVTTDD